MHTLLVLLLAFLSANSRLGENPRDASGLPVEHELTAELQLDSCGSCASTTAECLVASSSGTALARELGVAGEEAAGIVKNTTRIDSLSGTRAFRIPDGLTETTLTEVKNVAELSFNQQLQDSLHFALMTGRDFVLKVRPTTSLSQPLRDAIEAGYIILEFLP